MKTIGLACTGGGTKALSSLGVIKALEEYLMRENLIMAYENEKFYKTRIL